MLVVFPPDCFAESSYYCFHSQLFLLYWKGSNLAADSLNSEVIVAGVKILHPQIHLQLPLLCLLVVPSLCLCLAYGTLLILAQAVLIWSALALIISFSFRPCSLLRCRPAKACAISPRCFDKKLFRGRSTFLRAVRPVRPPSKLIPG